MTVTGGQQTVQSVTYTYDALDRLTQEAATGSDTVTYTYDAAGNRSTMTVGDAVTTYTYDANNRLTQTVEGDTVTTYTYDANGNTLTKVCGLSNTAYTYNGLDQQLTATVNGVTTSYAYNAQGIRTAKQTGTTRTDYLLDGGNVIGEVENGAISAQYLRGFNLISREAEETEYYLFNAHGDVVNLTDSTGTVTKSYDYDAFGNEVSPDAADENPFRYCGEYWDAETATYYLRARYYAPSIGRFTQQDTHWNTANMIYGDNPQKINEREDKLGLKTYSYAPQISAIIQSGNLYVYCGSNPVYYSDPTGKMIGPAVLGGAAAAGAANAWNPVGWVILGGVIIVGGVVSAIKLTQLLDEVYGKPQALAAKRDSDDVDWDVNEHRKDHIWRGTNNKHLKGWRNLGFDPKDPKSWNKLLPILKEVYEKGKEIKTSQNENGIIHRIQYYVDELGQTITVVIRETLEGKLILSDAWVE